MEAAMCSQVKKSFFKAVLPDSFQQLAIPETFHSEFVGQKCETGEAILRNHQHKDKVWHVKMEGFKFHLGWNYFVRDLDVRIGDYLMFRHEGGFVFDVLVFDNTGSEKHYQHFDDKMKDKTGEKKDSSSTENAENSKITEVSPRSGVLKKARSVFDTFKLSVTNKNLKSGILEIPRAFIRSCGMEDKIFKIVLKDEKGTTWSVNLNRDGLKGRVFMSSGWRDFVGAHNLTAGDTCSFKLINSRIRHKGNELVLNVTIKQKGFCEGR